jgi:hypothetical protein
MRFKKCPPVDKKSAFWRPHGFVLWGPHPKDTRTKSEGDRELKRSQKALL